MLFISVHSENSERVMLGFRQVLIRPSATFPQRWKGEKEDGLAAFPLLTHDLQHPYARKKTAGLPRRF